MDIKVTEISTQFGGGAWEYIDKQETLSIPLLGCRTKDQCVCQFNMWR